MSESVRVAHIDSQLFGDVQLEREVFESSFGDVEFETYERGVRPDSIGPVDVLITLESPVSGELIDAAGCSVVAVYATGFDMVDVEGATKRGVVVTRISEYCDREVGQHTIALALTLQRGLPHYDAGVKSGEYSWSLANPIFTWESLTFGFLAFGRKARAAADYAKALGFDILAHDPYMSDEDIRAAGAHPTSFEELLGKSDVLSIHAPLTPETEGMFDAETLAKMRDGAVLVNTGRGAVIEENALIEALEDGPLFGAGLDVTRNEPPEPDNPLLARDDVILTPHVAWNSEGAIERVRRRGSEIAIGAYRGRDGPDIVNPAVLH